MSTIFRQFDFETTGIPKPAEGDKNPQRHGVIETGWCDLVYNVTPFDNQIPKEGGVIFEPIGYLSNPKRDCDIEARAVHHIAPSEYADAPSPDRIFMKLSSGAPENVGTPNYFVAHNLEYESAFFGGGETPKICTFKVALRAWPEAPAHGLQILRYWLDLDSEPDFDADLALRPHRAPDDAYVTSFLTRRLLKVVDVETMVRWSRGPALLSRMTFGKYKTEFWKDVAKKDRGYLDWIVNKSDFDDRNVLATARYYLKLNP